MCAWSLCRVWLCETPWTVARQAPVHGILQARILEWIVMPSSRGSPDPGIEPRFPELQTDSLPSVPPGKPSKMTKPLLICRTDSSVVAVQNQWVSPPHLYSTSYSKLAFKGPASHYLWALKYPFYWNTVRWKEWVLVLESLNFQPNGTSLWHRNRLFKLGLHFLFPMAWGRVGAQWAGQGKGPAWEETWTADLTLPFFSFSQWLGTLGEELIYPVSRQGVEEMTGGEGPARGETTRKFWQLLSQKLWNTAPAAEGISQACSLENKVHHHQWQGFLEGGSSKEPTCQCKRCKICRFNPWVGKNPWRRSQQPTPVFLPGEPHGPVEPGGLKSIGSQRVGYNWSDSTCTSVTRLWEQGYVWARNWEGERYQSEKCLSLASPWLDLTQ